MNLKALKSKTKKYPVHHSYPENRVQDKTSLPSALADGATADKSKQLKKHRQKKTSPELGEDLGG